MHKIHACTNINGNPHYQREECAPNSGCGVGSESHIAVDVSKTFEGVDLFDLPEQMHGDSMVGGQDVRFENPGREASMACENCT